MSRVESSIIINVAPETILAVLEDVEQAPEWADNLQRVWDLAGKGAGCTYKWAFKFGPIIYTGATKVLESSPARFVMQTTGNIPSQWTWLMAPINDHTELKVAIEYTVPGSSLGALADKLIIEKRNQKELNQALLSLKVWLEEA